MGDIRFDTSKTVNAANLLELIAICGGGAQHLQRVASQWATSQLAAKETASPKTRKGSKAA